MAVGANPVREARTEGRPCCCRAWLGLIGWVVPLKGGQPLAFLQALEELWECPRGRSRHRHHRARPRFGQGCSEGPRLEKTGFRGVVEQNRVQKVCEIQCRIQFDRLGFGPHPAGLSHCLPQW